MPKFVADSSVSPTGLKWAVDPVADVVTTAGDLIYGTAADTVARLGIGTAGQVLKVNSGATAPEWGAAAGGSFVGCSLYKNSNQSVNSSADGSITFNDEFFDTDGFHSTSVNPARITIPSGKNGKYLFVWNINYASNSTGIRAVTVSKNGTLFFVNTTSAASADATRISGNIIFDLVATDFVTLEYYQTSGGSLDISGVASGTGAASRFSCIYLGA